METIIDLILGNLTTNQRIWTSLAPALLATSYFVIGSMVYFLRLKIKGEYHDAEIECRGESKLLTMNVRLAFFWLLSPLWRLISKTKIPPNAITTLSVLIAFAAGFSAAAGRFALAGWLYIVAGILDALDGRLARFTDKATVRGEALDSILDRYSDGAILMGLSWYYADTWVLFPCLLALVGSQIVPYVRARGAALGVTVKIGLMQRAERIVYLGGLTALSPVLEALVRPEDPKPIHALAVVGVVLLAISTHVTALQRLVYLLNALDESEDDKPLFDRGQVTRNIISGGFATAIDFLVVTSLVSMLFLSPVWATAVGCLVGAIVNFTMNREWTFKSAGARLPQAWRYGFVSFTSALLNMGGLAVLLMLPGIDYRICWVVVRIAVFVTWNFPLQRDYVFVTSDTTTEPTT